MLAWLKKGEGPLVAVDVGNRMAKAVLLEKGGERPILAYADIEEFAEEAIVKREFVDRGAISEVLRRLEENLGEATRRAITGVAGRGILVRLDTIPVAKGQKLQDAVLTHVRSLPGQDVDILYDFVELERTQDRARGILVVIHSEVVGDLLFVLRDAGFDPVVVDYEALALYNFYHGLGILPTRGLYGLLHIGYELTHLVVVQGGKPISIAEIERGNKFFAEGISRVIGLSTEDALKMLRGNIPEGYEENVSAALASIRNTYLRDIQTYILRSIGEEGKIDGIFVSGGGAVIPGLIEEMENILQASTSVVNALDYVDNRSSIEYEEGILLPVAVGMALRGIQSTPFRINLIPEEERIRMEEERFPIPRPDVVIPLTLAVVGGLVVAGGWWSRHSHVQTLQVKVDEMREELELRRRRLGNLADLRQKKDVLSRKIQTIRDLRTDQTRAVEDVDALVAALPSGVWLTEIQDQGNQLRVVGGAYHYAAVAEYLRRLKLVERFQNVRFVEAKESTVNDLGVFEFHLVVVRNPLAGG